MSEKLTQLPNGNPLTSNDYIYAAQKQNDGTYLSVKVPAILGVSDSGTATLSTGTKTVSSTHIKANSIVILTYNTVSINPDPGSGTSVLAAPIGSFVVGTSFVINAYVTTGGSSINPSDVSTVNWIIINP